jgi:hypothetical protein
MLARDALMNNPQRLLETGEPVALKGARRVREGAIGEGPRLERYLAGGLLHVRRIGACEIPFGERRG